MNEALAIPQGLATLDLGDLLTFVGLSSRNSANISSNARESVKGITSFIDDILVSAIEKRTKAEFVASRDAALQNYARVVRVMSELAKIMVPPSVVERLVHECFSKLEADFRDQGLSRFGYAVRDQAIFTIWTLRKIHAIGSEIAGLPEVLEASKEADMKCASQFNFTMLWTHFHLDCLIAAIRFDKDVYPEVLSEITNEIKAAVNAFASVRQGADLRMPPVEPTITPYEWDSEDQKLLDASMLEIEADSL